MKKFIWFLAGMMFATSATVFGYSYLAFTDEDSFEDWYGASAYKMFDIGVMTGDGNGYFDAGGYVNRAQMAVMLDRYDDYILNVVGESVSSGPSDPLEYIADSDNISAEALLSILTYVDLNVFDDYDYTVGVNGCC